MDVYRELMVRPKLMVWRNDYVTKLCALLRGGAALAEDLEVQRYVQAIPEDSRHLPSEEQSSLSEAVAA